MAIISTSQSKNASASLTEEDVNSVIASLSPIITLPADYSWENVTSIIVSIDSIGGSINIQNKI